MNILEQYKSSLKLIEVEEVIELLFYRPLAFILVKCIYNTSITPNQITFVGLIFGITGGSILACGNNESMYLAAIMFIVFNVLDCSDGQLARLKGNGTLIGRIFDGIADYMVSTAAYLGLGFGFAHQASSPIIYWALLAVAAISNIFHAILVDYYRNRFLDNTIETRSVLNDDLKNFRDEYQNLKRNNGGWLEIAIIGIYLKYSSIQSGLASENTSNLNVSKARYYAKNKRLIHFWTYLGPATQWTFLTICLLTNSINIYFLGIIFIYNTYAIFMLLIQKIIDRSYITI